MCKKMVVLLTLTLMIMTGCSNPMNFSDEDMDIYEKIYEKYMNMTSYSAKGILTIYSNKTENNYNLLQYAKEPEMYKTEFLDSSGKAEFTSVEKNGEVYISSLSGGGIKSEADSVPDCTFVNNFFSIYYKSAETTINVSNELSDKNVLLEIDIYPVCKNAKRAVMAVDNDANVKFIEIYDMGGNLRAKLTFTEFNYNIELSDDIFSVAESDT